jgi:threonine dehydratase
MSPNALDEHSVQEAGELLKGVVRHTPLLESDRLNAALGGRVLVKAECLQETGSFKYRAAYFRLAKLAPEERQRGVIAYSSGNFGIALAAAGTRLGIEVTIVAPSDAPDAKLERLRTGGANLVIVEPRGKNRETVASQRAVMLAEKSDAVLLHPFEDPLLLAAHAVLALEIIDDALGVSDGLDHLVVPCGGGGLLAACCWALNRRGLSTRLHAIEPRTVASLGPSLLAKRPVRLETPGSSLCDALCAPSPGCLAFDVLEPRVDEVHAVGDGMTREAVVLAASALKITVEPSGAIGLAALLDGQLAMQGQVTVTIATGGNLDLGLLASPRRRLASGANARSSAEQSRSSKTKRWALQR